MFCSVLRTTAAAAIASACNAARGHTQSDNQRQCGHGAIPAGRMGESDEIASAVVYLASDEAAYVTGQTLHVNGGMAMI